MEFAYRLEVLAKIFEQDAVCPCPVWLLFFIKKREQAQAEAMLQYLSAHGGQYCNKVIQGCFCAHACLQRPGTHHVCALLPALELMLGQWMEGRWPSWWNSDPHTISVIKSHFLNPPVPKIKLLGDLLTNAHTVGCTTDGTGGF